MNEISFTKKVKTELSLNSYSIKQKKAILSSYIRNKGEITIGKTPKIKLKTDIPTVAKFIYNAFKEIYSLDPEIIYENNNRFTKKIIYIVVIKSESLYQILEELEIFNEKLEQIKIKKYLQDSYLNYYFAGLFLSSGSINNPSKKNSSYFLEIQLDDENLCNSLLKKIDTFSNERRMDFKKIKRRNKFVLYLKKSDQISVFLSFIGAIESMFEYENVRIEKDERNISNKLAICDVANYKRASESGKKDIENISIYLKHNAFNNLSEKQKIIIKIRQENPDISYGEITKIANNQHNLNISRSGVFHIFNSIKENIEKYK